MKIIHRSIIEVLLLLLPDLVLAAIIVFSSKFVEGINRITGFNKAYVVYAITAYIIIRLIVLAYYIYGRFNLNRRIERISKIVYDFKKGKYIKHKRNDDGDMNELSTIYNELVVVGRNLDNVVGAQKSEIEKFHEFYNNIIFSINSYFVVIDEVEKIVFANEGFLKKLLFQQADVIGKRIDDVFQFVNARIKGGLLRALYEGESIIIEKAHLLSVTKVAIIADIKISNITVQGRRQIILVIDDVTSRLRKDYQMSLMSKISATMQHQEKIDSLLFAILTGVTSGSGIGFNRAMLFLADPSGESLEGKMAVGPDSFQEAIEIWSSISAGGLNLDEIDMAERKSGKQFMNKVMSSRFQMKDDKNILVSAARSGETILIKDMWNDQRIDPEMKEFMDVREFVVVPMLSSGAFVGLIVADNKFNQVPISNENIERLSIFASQAAMSVESFKNLEIVKKEMHKLEERQEAIVESEKMAAVGRIAAHISHEIRNPLVTMGGYARRIIQIATNPKTKGSVEDAAKIILKESERLEKTLSNVMDFAKPSKQIREFNSINEIITDTYELLKNIFLEKKIELSLDLDTSIPLVKSDSNQMKQVMLNLMQNAIDATPSGGSVKVETSTSDEYLLIKVSDTGSGIIDEDPNIVFEPFYTTKVTGVGLGLAIVKRIIKEHNGDIRVIKGEDSGVIFEIRLQLPV